MSRFLLAAAVSAAMIALSCSPGSERAEPAPGLDTLRAALVERDELERTYLLTSYLRTLDASELPAVLAEIEAHRIGIEEDEVRLVMLAWTRFDGPGAFATARDWPTPWRSVLMEQAVHAWGFNDGRAALAECDRVEDEELRLKLHAALIDGWLASDDRLGASEYAASVPNAKRRTRLAFRLAGQAKRDGPEAVMAWADAVPEDAPNQFKEAVFGFAAGVVARIDPALVVPWYENQMHNWYTTSGLHSIAVKWAQYHDATALVAWIQSLPVEEARESERADSIRLGFRTWAGEEPGEVAAWIESAPVDSLRDMAIVELARAIGNTSPDDALRWAQQIDDEKLRRKRVLRYSRKWFEQDPAAARAWFEEADIPDAWRPQILDNWSLAARSGNRANNRPTQ
jgi:hypothetical protein